MELRSGSQSPGMQRATMRHRGLTGGCRGNWDPTNEGPLDPKLRRRGSSLRCVVVPSALYELLEPLRAEQLPVLNTGARRTCIAKDLHLHSAG